MPLSWPVAVVVFVGSLISTAEGEHTVETEDVFHFRGRVLVPEDVHDPVTFLRNTKVVLDGGQHVGMLSGDGSFVIHDIPSASYTLEVYTPDHQYDMLRVDVSKKFEGSFRVVRADLVNGMPPTKVFYAPEAGLLLKPQGRLKYFTVKQGWSIWSLLANPMVLMMGMPLIMMYAMPKLMENMDEEQLADMKKQQKMMSGGGASGIDIAGALAGMTAGAGASSASGASKKKAK